MSTLEELWNGQVCPSKQAFYREEEYRKLTVLMERNKENLLPMLNQEQKEKLKNMEGIWEEMEYMTACGAFIIGFRLAVPLPWQGFSIA